MSFLIDFLCEYLWEIWTNRKIMDNAYVFVKTFRNTKIHRVFVFLIMGTV